MLFLYNQENIFNSRFIFRSKDSSQVAGVNSTDGATHLFVRSTFEASYKFEDYLHVFAKGTRIKPCSK